MSEPTAGNASSEPAPDEHDANTRPRQRRRVNDGSGGEEGGGEAVGSGDDARPDPAPHNDQDGGSNQAAASIKAAAATKAEERVTHRLLEKSKIPTGAWQGCENCKNRSQNGQNFGSFVPQAA